MIVKCSAMQTILNGFLKYRANLRGELIEKFKVASVNLNVFFLSEIKFHFLIQF